MSALVDLATAKSSCINEPVRMSTNPSDPQREERPWISGGWLEKMFAAIALRRSCPRKSWPPAWVSSRDYVSRRKAGKAQSHDCHDLARSGGVGRSSGRIVSGACSDSKAKKDPKADYPNIIRGCGRRGEIRSALDLLEAQEQFDPPDLSSRLKRIPGRGGGEFQISNIGAET